MTASPLAQKATDAFNAPICETDPEIAELLDSELGRQRSGLLAAARPLTGGRYCNARAPC